MVHLKMEVTMAMVTWAFASACQNTPVARNRLDGLHSQGNYDMNELRDRLSSTAQIWFSNSTQFENATLRWSLLREPKVNVVVVPGTENDVAETVGTYFSLWSLETTEVQRNS